MEKLKSLGVIAGTGILAITMAGCYECYRPVYTHRTYYIQPAPRRIYIAHCPMPRHIYHAHPRFSPHHPHHRR